MSLNWNKLTTVEELDALIARSHEVPCLIFKHSTRCEISSIAKYRLTDDWSFGPAQVEAYYLDLIAFRAVSTRVAEVFEVHHESPQVLLITAGECVYDASHLDITVPELEEALSSITA
jgi:bacillithiol system protein YtxJ